MQYEWDETKNLRNQSKHIGISFELATLVFDEPNCSIALDRVDETGELRWRAVGVVHIESEPFGVLLVVHAYRKDIHGQEIIRIISARRAEKHELRRYQKQEVD